MTRFCEQPGLRAVGGTKNPDIAAIVELRPDLVVVNEEENRREDFEALVAAGLAVHSTRVRNVGDVEPTLRALATAVGLNPAAPPVSLGPVGHRFGTDSLPHRFGADSLPHDGGLHGGEIDLAWQSGAGRHQSAREGGVSPSEPPRSAFVPIWRRPWMTINADTYGASLLATLGVRDIFADHPDRYPVVTLEDAVRRWPRPRPGPH